MGHAWWESWVQLGGGWTWISISSTFNVPAPGFGAASVLAMNHPGPCRYNTFSPLAETAKPLIPPRNGSVLRVVRSNLETVTGAGSPKRGTSTISERNNVPALPVSRLTQFGALIRSETLPYPLPSTPLVTFTDT